MFYVTNRLSNSVPPNVKFEIDDLEEEWTYSQPFDYIHSRMMTGSVNDWKIYLEKCFNHLKPGGYIELQEIDLFPRSDDGTYREDSALAKAVKLVYDASVIFGRPYQEVPSLVNDLKEVGFIDVSLNVDKWPSNPWPKDLKYKELGVWSNENVISGFEAITMAPLTRAHNWTMAEVQLLLVDVRKEINNRAIHAYWPIAECESRPRSTGNVGLIFWSQTVVSSTASVSSSILDYREENGRTYHRYKDGKYAIPNDEKENDRLGEVTGTSVSTDMELTIEPDLQHNLFLLTFDNALGLAPPNKPDSKVKRVLDVGTGTGIWAIDFGEDHPEAEVLGMDLSMSMPEFVPPNVKFEIDDLEEDWTYSQPFDYIHSRMMNSAVDDWKTYLYKCFNNLTPGGYFELQEPDLFPRCDDGTLRQDCALIKCIDLMYEASVMFGRPYQEIPPLVNVMKEVGFVDVEMHIFKWPSNPWPKDRKYKELGAWNNENFCEGFEGFSMAPLTRAHNWKKEEVQVFLIDVRKDLRDRNMHAYWPISILEYRIENGRTYHRYKDGSRFLRLIGTWQRYSNI
ncbi:Trans-aconitate 2-methyltransferase 12 [Colletotrichum chlorophyti]|uniref:Trans-aconitate 2-methyltransferase 12 n=1 Tax=Colletotrichum chlorophyti TaxID=708187 RepID=A0A1Q8R9P6_9PEZI|nr:Trans-aconitate 2-methyltransferase 12 [Colletotrichum chlorophyti]